MSADPFARFGPAVLDETTAARIARLRGERGWTVAELARRSSRSTSWIRQVESGAHALDRLSTIVRLARALDVEPLALIHTAMRDLTR